MRKKRKKEKYKKIDFEVKFESPSTKRAIVINARILKSQSLHL